MKMIKQLSHEIKHNIHEAREKIEMAYKLRDADKAAADWYRQMAAAHIEFNSTGHSAVAKLITEARAKMEHNPMLPGMLAVYDDMHAEVMKDSAEVSAMIQNYK